jgi:hypothetical protein
LCDSRNLRETGHVSWLGSGPFLFGCQAGFALSPDWRTVTLVRFHYYKIAWKHQDILANEV